MDTKKLLRRKSVVSYVYLLLALASFLLPLLAESEAFHINYPRFVCSDMPRSGHYIKFFAFKTLIIWMAAGFFCFDFYRGAFHFPLFYRENLKRLWAKREIYDRSVRRGLIGAMLVIVYFVVIVVFEEAAPMGLKTYFWLYLLIWIVFILFLVYHSQTQLHFRYAYVVIDPKIIDPHGEYQGRIESVIYFYFPTEELDKSISDPSEKSWAVKAVRAYLRDLKNQISDDEIKEKIHLNEIRDFTNYFMKVK